MYWTEPEGYEQWLYFKDNNKRPHGRLILMSVGVLCVTPLPLICRDFIGHQIANNIFLFLVISVVIVVLIWIRIAQLYFNIDLESTEIRLDFSGVFSGGNGEGRSSGAAMDEISSFKFELIEWKEHKFYNLVIEKNGNEQLMFGIGEFDQTRLRSNIEKTLTRGCC